MCLESILSIFKKRQLSIINYELSIVEPPDFFCNQIIRLSLKY